MLLIRQAHTIYHATADVLFNLQIYVYQDALMNAARIKAAGGAKGRGDRSREEVEKSEGTIKIDGVGDWAQLVSHDKLLARIYIGSGDYFMQLTTTGKPTGSNFATYGNEHVAWRKDFLVAAGKLAVERLKS